MDTNPYAAPTQQVDVSSETSQQRFYVVSLNKFLVLYFVTVGMYQVYWTYKHWAQFKANTKGDEWPIPRAIFAVFFTHSLFKEIDNSLQRSEFKYPWSASLFGGTAVFIMLFGNVMDRLSMKAIGSPTTDVLSIAVVPFIGFFLYQAQRAANHACGDPKGESNHNFTPANIIWLVIGVMWCMLVALGLLFSFFPNAFAETY